MTPPGEAAARGLEGDTHSADRGSFGQHGGHVQDGWSHWIWIGTLLLGAGAVVLGTAGFRQYAEIHGRTDGLLNSLYKTMQLFLLHGVELEDPLPWTLVAARFLAPAVLGFAALYSFFSGAREAARRVGLGFWRGHVVICGLGRKGLQLVRDFRAAGERVVAIGRPGLPDQIAEARRLGAIVLAGDPTDPGLLDRARVRHCRHLVAMTEEDAANIEIAAAAGRLVGRRPSGGRDPIRCFVHVQASELRRLLRRQPWALPFAGERFLVTVVGLDPYENAARLAFHSHALDHRAIARRDDPARVHLIVVGFGQMGESMLLQAARMAHFANHRRLRASVFDLAAKDREAEFHRKFPFAREVCDVDFVTSKDDDPGLPERIRTLACEVDALVTIALCLSAERRSLDLALRLVDALAGCRAPILVRLDSLGGYGSLFAADANHPGPPVAVHPFATVEQTYSRAVLLQEEMDRLARQIHADFVAERTKEGDAPGKNPALAGWDSLADDFKESNRQQADHIPVKLRALGYHDGPPSRDRARITAFTDEEVEALAEMEHARWIAERRLAGWSHAPAPKSVEKKTNPYLVPWDRLEESIKKYDRDAVRNIPRLLESVGRWIYRA